MLTQLTETQKNKMWDNFNVILNAAEKAISTLKEAPPNCWSASYHTKVENIQFALYRLHEAIILKTGYRVSPFVQAIPSPIKEEHKALLIKDYFDGGVETDFNVLNALDFSTIESMVCANILQHSPSKEACHFQGHDFAAEPGGFTGRLSLKDALNISRDNLFNAPGLTYGSFFGTPARSKENFDKDVNEQHGNREMHAL
jgi:hypothetical protein